VGYLFDCTGTIFNFFSFPVFTIAHLQDYMHFNPVLPSLLRPLSCPRLMGLLLIILCLLCMLYVLLISMVFTEQNVQLWVLYRAADKSLARPGRKQANVSVRMAWVSFGALPCRKKKNWWQLTSQCCWNRARPWHASELVAFLVGLRTYQHPGTRRLRLSLLIFCITFFESRCVLNKQ